MTIRNSIPEDSSHSAPKALDAGAAEPVISEPAQLCSGKASRKPRVEAQMRRRAEELRALLRDLD